MNITPTPYFDSVERARLLLSTDDCVILERGSWQWVRPEGWLVSGVGTPWSLGIKVPPEDRFTDAMINRVALWLDGLSMSIRLVFARAFDDHLWIDTATEEESAIVAEALATVTRGFVFQV